MSSFTLPENLRVHALMKPAADAAGRTSRYASLKQALKAWIVCYIDQGNAATVALSLLQATAVAGTGSKALANTVPIWTNLDVATNGDVLTRQTDAVSYTTDAGVKEKVVIFQVDPAKLDLANGFDCVGISTGASNVANITSAFLLVEPRYPGSASVATLSAD